MTFDKWKSCGIIFVKKEKYTVTKPGNLLLIDRTTKIQVALVSF